MGLRAVTDAQKRPVLTRLRHSFKIVVLAGDGIGAADGYESAYLTR